MNKNTYAQRVALGAAAPSVLGETLIRAIARLRARWAAYRRARAVDRRARETVEALMALDNRQLRLEHSRQGNWGYFLEYSEIPRFEPYVVTTAVTGIGTPNLTIPTTPTTGVPVDLETKRKAVGLGFEKYLSANWDVQVRFRNAVASPFGERYALTAWNAFLSLEHPPASPPPAAPPTAPPPHEQEKHNEP